MPRLVRHTLNGPIKVEPSDKHLWICGCGLSSNFPFCDGTHKRCTEEKPGMIYVYDPHTKQIVEERADEKT